MNAQRTKRRSVRPALYPNRIREYRLRAGLSQAELAQLVGHRRSIVCTWECGRALPTLPNAFRMAKALDTLAESLYWGLYSRSHHRSHT